MTMTPLEIALERIEECRRSHSASLDLSELLLDAIPEEVFELTWLKRLDVSWNRNGYRGGKITEIPITITQLTTLERFYCTFNSISDLSPLNGLDALQLIDCGNNVIRDLSPLSGLHALQVLICSANQIRDLSPLSGLHVLQMLDCDVNEITNLSPLSGLHALKILSCSDNYIIEGGLSPLSGLYALQTLYCNGSCINDLSPLSGLYTLQKLECRDNGISDLSPLSGLQTLQLLDCGGNQISNLLPLSGLRALQCLLCCENEIRDLSPIYHFVMSGQLRELRLFENPTIEVPSVILGDDWSDNCLENLKNYWHDLAKGMNSLRGAIQDVLKELKHKIHLELPTSWLQVQRQLKQLDQKSIPFAHFKQLCIKAGIDHAELLADYLHKTGMLFYHAGAFQDQIILDQNWAINAVYRAFDPNKPHRRRIERMGGRFNGEDASLFWADEEAKEQEVYVDFMRNCGICYEPKQQQNQRDNKPFAEREFIIPALLPLTSKAKIAWGNSRPDDWQLDIEYPFLHRSIIERMILRIGGTYEGEPWRTGIFCETDEGQLLLECEYANKQQSTQGRLHFQLRGNQLEKLVYALHKLVSKTSLHRRYAEYLSKAGTERTLLPEFKDEAMEHPSKLDASKPADKTIKLFISYSHADEAHKERLEKHLKAISRTLPLTAWSDHHLFAGEAVNEQIFQQLNTADIVLLLVSPDFINSDYCFTKEMERALERYQDEGNVVIPIIIRHTASWRNHKIGQIVALPKDGKPLAKWEDADEFWGSVEDGIRDQVKRLLQA